MVSRTPSGGTNVAPCLCDYFGKQILRSLVRLVPVISQYKWLIFAGLATFFVARFFEISTYYAVSLGVDRISFLIEQKQQSGLPDLVVKEGVTAVPYTLLQIALAIIFCVCMRFLFVVHARRSIRRAGISTAFDLRQRVYETVQLQGSDFFSRIGIGDIMIRAIQDIALIQRLISHGLVQVIIMIYAPFFGLAAMMMKSPSLTLLILPLLPLLFVYAYYMSGAMARTAHAMQTGLSALSQHTQENLSGIRTIQAQAQEENEIKRFRVTNDTYADAFYDQSRISSLMSAWTPFFASMAQLVILLYGGHLVIEGEISVGDLVFFFTCLNMLLQPVRMAGYFITTVQRSVVATDRLFEIYDAEPEIKDAPTKDAPPRIQGGFELRNLTFTYPRTDQPVLRNINLHIKAGESIAIVGRVGSGKSTLLKQFTRMVDTNPGQLFLDGHDIRDYPLQQLRMEVAQVLQDPFLFGEPLRHNISYDDPERRLDAIWDAADAAALRSTIEDFPARMETVVGERGVTLSGGEKQRTTLARGLIRNAPVLILDDCFSSVDTETEEHILGRLKAIRRGMTTILVSHRISTLRHSNRIIVLEEGCIAELGSHEELLRLNGIYAELERIQTKGQNRDTAVLLTT